MYNPKFVDAQSAGMQVSILAAKQILKTMDADLPKSTKSARTSEPQEHPEITGSMALWRH